MIGRRLKTKPRLAAGSSDLIDCRAKPGNDERAYAGIRASSSVGSRST